MASPHLVFDEWEDEYAERNEHLRRSAVRDLFAAVSRPNVIGLSGGSPDISSLPLDQVADCAKNVVDEFGLKALQYGSSEGRPEMRRVVADMLAEDGIDVDIDQIIITNGSQQALDFMGRVFIDPGDTIIVEGPSYLGALQAFSAYMPDVRVVPMDDDGMRTDKLEELLEELGPGGAKFIYTIPNFQNPAGVTMTLERRKRLLELAHEYQITVIEDDPYGKLRFEGEHVPPLKSMDPNVIYLGTTSKIFAPGLRLAWCVAPKPIIEKINLSEQGAGLCVSAFTQCLCEQYFTKTDWKGTLKKSQAIYRSRRDALIGALEEYFPEEATWTHPEGGLFVWVTLPPYFDTMQMMSAALERGVAYVPGSNCYPDGQGKSSIRLAFSYEPEENLREGVRRLADTINDRLELYRAFMKAGALPKAAGTAEASDPEGN